jgi:hypothetical protein
MARKDLEKETERPRYYSQFWLDVAAGRRVIGAGKGAEGGDESETEEESVPELTTKAGKASKASAVPPVVEAEPAGRRQNQPLRLSGTESLADLAAAAGLVDLESDEDVATLEEDNVSEDLEPTPEAVETPLEEEPVEETYSFADLYDEEEEEDEEDEEGGWSSSRRGKKQQHKKQEKPRRREKGRDF